MTGQRGRMTGVLSRDVRDDVVRLDGGWRLWRVAALRSAGLPFGVVQELAVPALLDQPAGSDRDRAIRAARTAQFDRLIRNEVLREALAWQNPALADSWPRHYADRLAAGGEPHLANRAYREVVLARYAQRYCARNESIGFFGAVAWARLVDADCGLRYSGAGGVRRRTSFLETWAAAAVAQALERTPGVFDLLPVRLHAACSVAGGMVREPRRPPVRYSGLAGAVLTAVDGVRTVGAVLAHAAAATGDDADEVRAELLRLRDRGVLRIGFRVPHHERPELLLRGQIERLPDPSVRDGLLAALDGVAAAATAAADARGPAAVTTALGEVSRSLVAAGCTAESTGRRASHGRTPVYLDCRRDVDVTLGADLIDGLATPLGVLLDSARWLAAEVADAVEAELRRSWRWLLTRRDEVTLADLQFAAGDVLATGGQAVREVQEDLQLRWSEIISAGATAPLHLRGDRVRAMADALFPSPGPLRWAASRQHSPDLLLGRTADGATCWVLGELHVAMNTLESRLFRTQCDDPAELVESTARDMSRGRVVPVYPRHAAGATARTSPPTALDPPGRYRYWSYDADDGRAEGAVSVPATAVTVHEVDGRLIGRAEGHGWSAPVLEFFGEFLSAVTVNLFTLRPRAPHLYRVLIDDLVICRESWSFPAGEVPVPVRPGGDAGYQRLRDWGRAAGMPRHVFVRTPGERKPYYVDFAAPLLLANLARAVRRAAEADPQAVIDVVEMLPSPDQLWLTDAAGHRYTSEFRMVAVDALEPAEVVTTVGVPTAESQVAQ
ncbi:MAG: hypothetical protein E6F99_06535 [Actinobacteria bacterium]|nr:MAG: hypothetical protein E6F99_06535 [Actinomycetota bacterium]